MTTEELRSKIMGSINASFATATYISWPNQDFKAPVNGIWIRPVIKLPSTIVGELGSDGIGLRDGLLMISIFGPKGHGLKATLTLADRLEHHFRRKDIDNIWFDEPNSNPLGVDANGYDHVLMTCDFHNWIGE